MRCCHLDGHRRRPRIAFAVRWSCFRCAAALSACHLPAYPRLENHPFRLMRASDVDAALPCLRPGFPILASRQLRRHWIEASIDRGQSSRTHATGHAVESPSRLRWQPRIIVRYSRGPQPRRNTKWRRPRYTLRQDPPLPPWFEFLVIFDFFAHGIEEVERHLQWKCYKKIRKKSWSNVPPNLLACIGFLYKVVHKIGRLRKFNRSREIEFNFLTAWTISMKFGTLVQHAPGYKTLASDVLIFAWGLSYGISKSKKGGKIVTKLWKIITKSLGKI